MNKVKKFPFYAVSIEYSDEIILMVVEAKSPAEAKRRARFVRETYSCQEIISIECNYNRDNNLAKSKWEWWKSWRKRYGKQSSLA